MDIDDDAVSEMSDALRRAHHDIHETSKKLRLEWLMSSVSMSGVSPGTFSTLCDSWTLRPHMIVTNLREMIARALEGELDDKARETELSAATRATAAADLAAVVALDDVQCACLLEAVQDDRAYDGDDQDGHRAECYGHMQARSTGEVRRALWKRSLAELPDE